MHYVNSPIPPESVIIPWHPATSRPATPSGINALSLPKNGAPDSGTGVLWLDYEASGDEEVARHADRYTRSIGEIVKAPVFDHDLGFLVLYSYGNGYLLTKNPEYREIMLNAADSLATLFNPKAGTICSWYRNEKMLGGHNTIMDNMINLELLFWAAKNGGDRRLYDIAVSHADTTMRYNFRPDGTSYHVAVYDKNT